MSIKDLEMAFEILKEKKCHVSGQKPLEYIDKAEKVLGLKFPNSYKEFLLKRGCGNVRSYEFYGIVDDDFENSSVPDGIWLTLDEREKNNLLHEYILIGDANEGWYALDTSKMNNEGECPVVIWQHHSLPKEKIEVIASDFGKFFLDQVSRA